MCAEWAHLRSSRDCWPATAWWWTLTSIGHRNAVPRTALECLIAVIQPPCTVMQSSLKLLYWMKLGFPGDRMPSKCAHTVARWAIFSSLKQKCTGIYLPTSLASCKLIPLNLHILACHECHTLQRAALEKFPKTRGSGLTWYNALITLIECVQTGMEPRRLSIKTDTEEDFVPAEWWGGRTHSCPG